MVKLNKKNSNNFSNEIILSSVNKLSINNTEKVNKTHETKSRNKLKYSKSLNKKQTLNTTKIKNENNLLVTAERPLSKNNVQHIIKTGNLFLINIIYIYLKK